MGTIYFNDCIDPFVDVATAHLAVMNTIAAYENLKDAIKIHAQNSDSPPSQLILAHCPETGIAHTLTSILQTCAQRDKAAIISFLSGFSRGEKITIPDCYEKILSSPDIGRGSKILQYALEQDGVALTFSNNDVWSIDFITF